MRRNPRQRQTTVVTGTRSARMWAVATRSWRLSSTVCHASGQPIFFSDHFLSDLNLYAKAWADHPIPWILVQWECSPRNCAVLILMCVHVCATLSLLLAESSADLPLSFQGAASRARTRRTFVNWKVLLCAFFFLRCTSLPLCLRFDCRGRKSDEMSPGIGTKLLKSSFPPVSPFFVPPQKLSKPMIQEEAPVQHPEDQ